MQRDIEQWKPNEVARLLTLVETERRYYQDLFSALPVAVAVVESSGAFVAVNREFRRMLGVEASQLQRARLTDYLDAPGLGAALARAVSQGEAAEPLTAQTRTGDMVRLTIAPAGGWSAEGSREAVAVVERASGSGAESGDPAIPGSLWHVEAGGEPAVPGEVFAPDLEVRQRHYAERPRLSAHESLDYRVRTPQGRLLWLRDHSLIEGGRVWGFTVDVTEELAAREQKVERVRREAAERLAARVAHVANNLLMIVNGYGEEILQSLHEADTRRGDMEEILKASERLAALTQDLSLLARPPHYESTQFALESWLPAAAERLRGLMPQGVALTVAAESQTVSGNPHLLERVLAEALRYLGQWLRPDQACLIEAGMAEEGRCRMVVSLPGVRLDEEAAGRMFEPFSGPKTGADPALGVAGLVRPFESLGGSLRWELADPAQSRLVLEMPAAAQVAAGSEAGPAATVLVVEDEQSIRQLIVKSLERNGYKVLQASGPIEALALTATQSVQPDLLVTDLMVPGMDGRTFAARMREKWPGLPVLYVSGFTGDPELTAQLSRGVLPANTRFLAKPFGTRDLLEAAGALLTRSASAGR